MIRVILCDDEQLALRRLGDMVGRFPDVDVVAMARNGGEALKQIASLRPDVVFLDVEMPRIDGFDVVEELIRQGGHTPLIVFATAYPQFAPSAFDSGAIDFLTKPVRMGRLETTLARIRNALEDRSAKARFEELSRQLESLRIAGATPATDAHIWIQRRGESVRVPLDQIEMVKAEAEYVRIMLGNASYLHREPLSEFLKRLDPAKFVRVHRSLIVNRSKIATVRRNATGSYRLIMQDGSDLPVGRSYRHAVRQVVAPA